MHSTSCTLLLKDSKLSSVNLGASFCSITSPVSKPDGFAIRVPIPVGSIVDLVVNVRKEVTVESVNAALKASAEGPMKGILVYCDEPIVSSDVVNNPASSIFDSLCTMVIGKTIKAVSWYDNEWGYSNRSVDIMERMAAL